MRSEATPAVQVADMIRAVNCCEQHAAGFRECDYAGCHRLAQLVMAIGAGAEPRRARKRDELWLCPPCAQRVRQAPSITDLNCRSMLTTPEDAWRCVESLAPAIDTVIASSTELAAVCGLTGEPLDVAGRLRERLGVQRVVVSERGDGRAGTQVRRSACADDDEACEVTSPEFRTVDPLGGGDAFSADFLHGFLEEGPRRGLELGGVLAALKQSIPGDSAIVHRDEIDHLLNGDGVSTLP